MVKQFVIDYTHETMAPLMEHEVNGNLTKKTNRNGSAWIYTYAAENRLTAETDPLGNVTAYTYDEVGNLTKTTSPAEFKSSYEYDSTMLTEAIHTEIDALTAQRKALYNKNNPAAQNSSIESINQKLRALRHDLKMCAG